MTHDDEPTRTLLSRLNDVAPAIAQREGELAPGHWIDHRYQVQRSMGWGGMGAVYMAEDARLQREVAIKIIHPSVAADPMLCAMFRREAESMAQLRHPNVVEVYDLGQAGACPYLVMPYVQGRNLNEWVRDRDGPPLPIDVMVGIMGQACAGVAAMHACKLVHGDLKPSNILVSESFSVVVGDLGLATRVTEGRRFSLLGATPGYLAPELIVHEDIPAERAYQIDAYALGVVAYWLIVGQTPVGSGQSEEVLRRQIEDHVAPPSERRPELPRCFDAPLLHAVARDPVKRSTVAEFRDALLQARDEVRQVGLPERPFVVLVDDDEDALTLGAKIVRAAIKNVELVAVRDPLAAVSLVDSRTPDLVITDLAMPRLNGLELLAILRGHRETHEVPVIVVTAAGGAPDWELARRLGASRFFLKPIDADLLSYAVRRALARWDRC